MYYVRIVFGCHKVSYRWDPSTLPFGLANIRKHTSGLVSLMSSRLSPYYQRTSNGDITKGSAIFEPVLTAGASCNPPSIRVSSPIPDHKNDQWASLVLVPGDFYIWPIMSVALAWRYLVAVRGVKGLNLTLLVWLALFYLVRSTTLFVWEKWLYPPRPTSAHSW